MIKKIALSVVLALGLGAGAQLSAATPTWTPTSTPSRTPTVTPTVTGTATPTATPTRFVNDAATWGQPDWERPALSTKGGSLSNQSIIVLGKAQGNLAGIALAFQTGSFPNGANGDVTITAGQAVAQVASRNYTLTRTAQADQAFVGIAWNSNAYANDRVYVVTRGIVPAFVGPGVYTAGEAMITGANGNLTPSTAISDATIYTALSQTVVAYIQENKTITAAAGSVKVRLK